MIYAATKKLIGIGGMRCGSTSIHKYLCQHPYIHGPEIRDSKEMHFFDQQSCTWQEYVEEAWLGDYRKDDVITENTPEYLPFEPTPERIMDPRNPLMWNAKFYIVLRDPIDRAYSHWKKRVNTGEEKLSFEKALACEDTRIAVGLDQIKAGQGNVYSHMPFTYGYKFQSDYARHLKNWFAHIDRDRIYIIRAEDFWFAPQLTLNGLTQFAGLDPIKWDCRTRHNASADQDHMSEDTWYELCEHFAPQVEDLQRLLHAEAPMWPWITEVDFLPVE